MGRKEGNMPRKSRKSLGTSFFHIIVQGVNREFIFDKEEYIKKYLELMEKYKSEYNICILSYCIMNNHAHMLAYIEDINNMSKFMHKINVIYSQYYNRCENRVGIVFRNRYVSEAIYEEKYLANCINYIHMNPVRAHMVERREEYQYSSYNEFKNSKYSILIEIFGKDYVEIVNNIENDFVFYDVDFNKEEYLNYALKEYERIKQDNLMNIINNKESLKDLIKYLKQNYKITYVDLMKKFGITKGEMNSLKR